MVVRGRELQVGVGRHGAVTELALRIDGSGVRARLVRLVSERLVVDFVC